MAELLPRVVESRGPGEEPRTSASPSMPRRSTGSICRSNCSADSLHDPSLAGWNGLGLAVQAYGKRAKPVLAWLADLAAETGRRIPVRLVKGAYWDTEIKRAQEAGLEGYPLFTRKVVDRCQLSRLRQVSAVAARCLLSAIRDPQCAYARGDRGHGRREPRASNSSACTAWARRSMRKIVAHDHDASSPAASMRRSAAMKICSPIWCGGCSRTAPIPPSSTGLPTTRRRSARSSPIRSSRSRASRRSRIRAFRRRAISSRRAGTSKGYPLWDDETRESPRTRDASAAAANPMQGNAPWSTAPAAKGGQSSAITAPHDRRMSSARLREADERGIAGRWKRRRRACAGLGRARRRSACREFSRKRPISMKRTAAELMASSCARPARPRTMRSRTCARPSISCATMPSRARADFASRSAAGPDRRAQRTDAAWARRLRLHQPVEFSARDLHRPGGGGARRRQQRDRQARRADAARRLPRPCGFFTRPASPAMFCISSPATARASARSLLAHPALSGVAFTGSNETAAIINRSLAGTRRRHPAAHCRDRRHECDDRRFLGPAGTGGARRDRLGLRQCRTALLGGAHPVRAGRHRAEHSFRCSRAPWRN